MAGNNRVDKTAKASRAGGRSSRTATTSGSKTRSTRSMKKQRDFAPSTSATMPPPPPLAPLVKAGTKRKIQDDEDAPPTTLPKPPVLKPRIRHVPQETVETKWSVLPGTSREEIMDVVRAAERPVLMTFRKENRRIEAQGVLRGVVRKLGNSLTKVPVPPMGKDGYLNYERLIDRNRTLEAILEPELRQIADLEAEIEREQKLLEKEEDYLAELKKNAVAQETLRKQKTRNMHRVLRNTPTNPSPMDSVDRVNIKPTASAASYDVSSDRQLRPLTIQLQQHLASMQGNSGSLGEVAEWILKGRAAVDDVLFRKGGEQVYDDVMGV